MSKILVGNGRCAFCYNDRIVALIEMREGGRIFKWHKPEKACFTCRMGKLRGRFRYFRVGNIPLHCNTCEVCDTCEVCNTCQHCVTEQESLSPFTMDGAVAAIEEFMKVRDKQKKKSFKKFLMGVWWFMSFRWLRIKIGEEKDDKDNA